MTNQIDWDEIYQEAVQKIHSDDHVGSGTYNLVVPVERSGKIYAVRIAREEIENANTPFNDLQMLTNAYPQMGMIIDKLQEGSPAFCIPQLQYVSGEKIGTHEEQRPKFAVFDWIPNAVFLSDHPAYQYGSPLPASALAGIDDYIQRWTTIPTDQIMAPSDWHRNDNRAFAINLLDHAQHQYEAALPKYQPLLEALGFSKEPFAGLKQAFTQMNHRTPCFIETDRNVENVLFSHDDPTYTPILIDLDGLKIGDFVYGVKALEHRIDMNLLDKENQRMERLNHNVDPAYTQGWQEDIKYYDQFELIRNSIMNVLVNGKKYLENTQTDLPDKFVDCYNELRTNVWNEPAFTEEVISGIFKQFAMDKKRDRLHTYPADRPNSGFLEVVRTPDPAQHQKENR